MSSQETIAQPTSAVMNTYARFPESMVRGEGVYLFDDKERRFLDFFAGIAVNGLGHCHPHLVKTLQEQAAKLWHVTNLYHIPDQERLAKRMTENSFADRVFFTNSGMEAMEGMIKLARRYHYADGNPNKWRIVTVQGAFHGRSLATISAAGNPKYTEGFGPAVDGFDNVPFGNLNELRAAITEDTAAILIEPIQGEGGIRPVDMEYMKALRAAADEFGLLLILDEVQSGNGRTGKMWGHEWSEVKPDAIATAKGMGGGFPVGAFMATEEAAKGMQPGLHGTTYGGNPLAMAVGNAVLDVVEEEGFLEHVQEMAVYLQSKLDTLVANHPSLFSGWRGAGLMLGLQCNADNVEAGAMVAAFKDESLLTVGAGDNVVRLLPPLTIEKEHIDEAIAAMEAAAQKKEA